MNTTHVAEAGSVLEASALASWDGWGGPPAVACGLVALDGLVKASGPAVGDEDGLARVLAGFF
jgi:hypothetical protein